MRLAENTGRKKLPKSRHLRSIVQFCLAISSQLRHISTIGKKLVKQQYLLQMSPQYGELRPTSGWDRFTSLGHPCKFQRVSRLGSVTAQHSSSGRQPKFAALNRGRYLYSAWRPSRWALAHILVIYWKVPWSVCRVTFWTTVTSNGLPYATEPLSCLSCLFVTLVFCGQTVGWIRIPLGTEVGLGPGDIVLDGDPAPPRKGA